MSTIKVLDKEFKLYIKQEEIESVINDIANQINEEYKEKNRIRFELENEVEEMLGGNSTAEYKIFDDFLTAFYDEYEVLLEEMYLLGAYDRERMLR